MILAGFGLNFVKASRPIKALVYSAVMNGEAASPLIVLLLLICNNRNIVQERVNGRVSNVLRGLTIVLMSVAAAAMFWGPAPVKMS